MTLADTPQPTISLQRSRNLLREMSDQAVLETVIRESPITRPELAARTGLSKPTVSEAVRRLIQARLIRSAGVRSGNLGRSPVSYIVDDAAGYVIGVDIGGTNIRVAAVDIFGELIVSRSEEQSPTKNRDLAHQVNSLVREIARTTGATHSQLLAVGASLNPPFPGSIEATTSDPLSLLRKNIGVPVFSDTGINLSAVGEKWRGLAKGVKDFVFVSVGASVGVGIVVADQLVRGSNSAAGNISMLPNANKGGNARLGGSMDAASWLEQANSLHWTSEVPVTIGEIFGRADSEASSRELIAREVESVAMAIATITAVLDPELVVIGGGIGSYPELLRPVQTRTESLLGREVRIETSQLSEQAALYGALAVALLDAHNQLFRAHTTPSAIAALGGS